ncbi:unnamed protein product [Paramecium octaurelia]|uniref:Uncharacterized protein n=1 Tax=Paramecium octaurelia TaxID=43137 RepID=A0A8S1SCJ3_PAROT|nr:unnamed protein product [Paramecium octaurelia]
MISIHTTIWFKSYVQESFRKTLLSKLNSLFIQNDLV